MGQKEKKKGGKISRNFKTHSKVKTASLQSLEMLQHPPDCKKEMHKEQSRRSRTNFCQAAKPAST